MHEDGPQKDEKTTPMVTGQVVRREIGEIHIFVIIGLAGGTV